MRSRRSELMALAALVLAVATFVLTLQGRLPAFASPDTPDAPQAIANTLNYQGILRDEQGARPVHGGSREFQSDPHWRDLVLFYEYFHGDTGAGLGASHQTGWTGLAANLIQGLGWLDADRVLEEMFRTALVYQPAET